MGGGRRGRGRGPRHLRGFQKRGLPIFLRALAQLPTEVQGRVRAVVVGKGTRPGPYLDLVRSLGLGDRVQFESPQVHVEALYHALDVYVHPAPFEEFGMSVRGPWPAASRC